MKFFELKKEIYPIFALLASLTIMTFGLATAKQIECTYFLIAIFSWFLIFGYYKNILKMLLPLVLIGGIFVFIAYTVSSKWQNAMAMANRFGAIFISLIPCLSIEPVRLTRSLSAMKMPRSVTLGMLIATSFMPFLKTEIKRVREAIKTRGAGSVLSPKIFYRAFLVPFVMRLINISDTLSLSIETRGFTVSKSNYSIYKRESVTILDCLFFGAIFVASILVVVL